MWVNAKATHIFSAKILAYMPYLTISLTNDIVSFGQLGPGLQIEIGVLIFVLFFHKMY